MFKLLHRAGGDVANFPAWIPPDRSIVDSAERRSTNEDTVRDSFGPDAKAAQPNKPCREMQSDFRPRLGTPCTSKRSAPPVQRRRSTPPGLTGRPTIVQVVLVKETPPERGADDREKPRIHGLDVSEIIELEYWQTASSIVPSSGSHCAGGDGWRHGCGASGRLQCGELSDQDHDNNASNQVIKVEPRKSVVNGKPIADAECEGTT